MVVTRSVWSCQSCDKLIASLECTDWSVFFNECLDIFIDTVVGYINYCVETNIPKRSYKAYSNNKPWVCREVVEAIRRRRQMEESWVSAVEKKQWRVEVQRIIRQAKIDYAKKITSSLRSNKADAAWNSLKHLLDIKRRGPTLPDCSLDQMNEFFCRFDEEVDETLTPDRDRAPYLSCTRIKIDEEEVNTCLKRLNKKKPPGPDNLHPRVLNMAADPLTPILTQIFQKSLHERLVPKAWKISKIKPIPKNKKKNSKEPSDYRPVALTSALVKIMEGILLRHLRVNIEQDNQQFAYKPRRGTTDAILCMTDSIIQHTESKAGNYARCLFIDFSSAFNTVNPAKLISILEDKGADPDTLGWISSFLQDRCQFIELGESTSSVRSTHIGTPQGSVISPFLFTVYISGIQVSNGIESAHIFKYADDIVVMGLCGPGRVGEMEYVAVVEECFQVCRSLNLIVNKSKTKEMIMATGRKRPEVDAMTIEDCQIETVSSYKYLGTQITEDLNFDENWNQRIQKARQRLYMLRKLKYSKADKTIIRMTFSSFIAPVITYHLELFMEQLSVKTVRDIRRLEKTAGRAAGVQLPKILDDNDRKNYILSLFLDEEHPFSKTIQRLPSGRLKAMKHRTVVGRKCFRSVFIKIVNDTIFTR
jgi:hypothetical protein